MKTKRFLFLFLLFVGSAADAVCSGRPFNYLNVSYPQNVNLFDLFEVSFDGEHTLNPYEPDSITVLGVFIAPDNERDTVIGFYYEGYSFQNHEGYEVATPNPSANCWKLRFTPDKVGTWSFYITGTVGAGGSGQPNPQRETMYSFNCVSVRNADGFISLANSRYLKRDVVRNGQRQYHSFFPIGSNVAWYSNYLNDSLPLGIYHYEKYIDSLHNNANYMRVFINRFRHLGLFGPEYTMHEMVNGERVPVVFFDSSLNQKDAAELDAIMEYAADHGVTVLISMLNCAAFTDINHQNPSDPDIWQNNPFKNILQSPCDFFTDSNAKRITRNLIRYIIARWGYATNIVGWELWNEVSQVFSMCNTDKEQLEDNVVDWHNEMASFIRSIDPFNHCVTTSMGSPSNRYGFYSELFSNMDYVQQHYYGHIQKARSNEQLSKLFFDTCQSVHAVYPTKPFFMGEFGFGQHNSPSYTEKDPNGVDLHNTLWSSFFSSSMGTCALWWWQYQTSQGLFRRYKPILTFSRNLPILSDSFQGYTTGQVYYNRLLVFPNNIETYYMKNATEDTIYGWCQDTAFCYQSLRWLTDSVYPGNDTIMPWHFKDSAPFDPNGYIYTMDALKKPAPSSTNNNIVIPISNQAVNATYKIRWYDSETGLEKTSWSTFCQVRQSVSGNRYISFNFPSFIRNTKDHVISNTFGDAVFSIIRYYEPRQME